MNWKLYIIGCVVLFSGCASMDTERGIVTNNIIVPEAKGGVYHKVLANHTLWRIAKTYNVSINDIIRANSIPNAAKIEQNQLIFIPGAKKVREIKIESGDEKKEFVWPVEGKVIKYFKENSGQKISKGIDIQVRSGQKVNAARSGKVVFADYLCGHNQMVILDHEDGFYSVYSQNAKLLVKLGDYIFKSAPISIVDADQGQLAYLHFEIRKKSIEDNPLYYLP